VWAVQSGAGKVYSFEPNPVSLPYLERNAEKFGQGRIVVVPKGVGDRRCRISLAEAEAGNIGSAAPVEGSDGPAEIVTLDEWARETKVVPDFIKMDLEGYETKALLGAREIITRHRPRLAIALYHYIIHHWEIPLLLKEMGPEYRFWCRKNSLYNEFIMYATV
jgi:FkbM family methyltransferase